MKRVLIISPYFAPVNAADMHRVRMSLPYFKKFGWEAEVVCVNEKYVDLDMEPMFMQNISSKILIHRIKAFPKYFTIKFGLGSVALRSLWYYKTKVNQLLAEKKYDLVYFSTTQFPVCILGNYWKKKFNIPYVIDFQDPWHTEYYQDKPKNQRPKKYWLSYRLNKYLEPIALKNVSGLISVSKNYINDINLRYPKLKNLPHQIIPFSAEYKDFEVALKSKFRCLLNNNKKIKILYAGVVGSIMIDSISKILLAFKALPMEIQDRTELYFLGTSYAPKGTGIQSVLPIANLFKLANSIVEITDRLSFYNTLNHLKISDGLVIIGSDDLSYIPSKIYTYLLANKPIFSLLKQNSEGNNMLRNYTSIYQSNIEDDQTSINQSFLLYVNSIIEKKDAVIKNKIRFTPEIMTKQQTEVFNSAIG
ncbi:hypothetical protein ACFOWA_08985 [Pedobacter lithocola]|uniref:Glycosyltransferase subfamily 4-like N-terminal domain-containing protein n=1 Tax=Pedobacter lithocola TaxID=1908239 RepID=A0ABV8P7X0_9SPHI